MGHVFTNDLRDDADILRQRRALCGRANMILRKFYHCSVDVKSCLFNAFCNNIYGNYLWCDFNVGVIRSITVSHNNALRRLFGYPSYSSASKVFVNNSVNCLSVLRRRGAYNFRVRLQNSNNVLINGLLACDRRFYGLQAHWIKLFY